MFPVGTEDAFCAGPVCRVLTYLRGGAVIIMVLQSWEKEAVGRAAELHKPSTKAGGLRWG